MIKIKTFTIFLSVMGLVALSSCENDDANSFNSAIVGAGDVNDAVIRNGTTSSLEVALKAASGDLPGTLQGAGPFTLFAPTNAAFEALAVETGFKTADSLLASADAGLLEQILTYHVVAENLEAGNLTEGKVLVTVNGDELTVNVDDEDSISLSDASKLPQTNAVGTVLNSNTEPTNGIVHFIDKVLLPDAAIEALKIDIRPTILEQAKGNENLTVLVEALAKADLVDTFAALDTTTVLAPTNDAFTAILEALGPDYNSLDDLDNTAEIALLSDILKYHVLSTDVLAAGEIETAFEENSIVVSGETGSFTFEDATGTTAATVTADVEAKNGFVQVVDKVLLPQAALDFIELIGSEDIATLVTTLPNSSLLTEALNVTKLADTFVDKTNESFKQGEEETDEDFAIRRTPNNFTYFKQATVLAPSDAAFAGLLNALGDDYNSIADFDTDEELELLTDILLYHVIEGRVESGDLSAGAVTTLGGNDINLISVLGTEGFVIGDATDNVNAHITQADLFARNGVSHVIDKVLLPKSAIDFINSLNEEEEEEEEESGS